jgi:hypothetical protein
LIIREGEEKIKMIKGGNERVREKKELERRKEKER